MPRHSIVVPEQQRIEYIVQRVRADEGRDVLPIWEGNPSVQCKIITIPLTHLVLRVNNARTLDSQALAISESITYDDGAGGESPPAKEETFSQENEDTQETQDHQYELLLIEAQKSSGRQGTRNLVDIILEDGWTAEDRPVITEKGVLINGNSRISAIEYLLHQNLLSFEAHNIDPNNPRIEVKVVPTPAEEFAIEELERKLQLGDEGKLEYNWIQVTTDMRRILDRTGGDHSQVLVHYRHLAKYSTVKKINDWLLARDILDSSLASIGKSGQQMSGDIPEFLFEMAAKENNLATREEWEKYDVDMLDGLVSIFLAISMAGAAEREMRYNLQEVKKATDVERFYLDYEKESGAALYELKEVIHPVTGEKLGEKPVPNLTELLEFSQEEIEVLAKQSAITASRVKDSNDTSDLSNKPMKKLIEVGNNIRFYNEAMDIAKAQKVKVDAGPIKTKITELIVSLKDELKKL